MWCDPRLLHSSFLVGKLTATTSQGATKQALQLKLSGRSPVKKVLQASSNILSKMRDYRELEIVEKSN
jgi:hypothetical protein